MARAPALQEIEAVPEADRLDDAPHPRQTQVLHGHEWAEKQMAATFATGRMHHGWLIAGPSGIGKATLAYRLARHILAKPGERDPAGQSLAVAPETTAARQVLALSHPGLLLIRRPWDAKGKRFTAAPARARTQSAGPPRSRDAARSGLPIQFRYAGPGHPDTEQSFVPVRQVAG